jgi:hypothetical protein
MIENAKQHLDNAFKWLSKIPVTDESVDYMAMARQELREAFRALPDDNPDCEVKATDEKH